MWQCPECGRNFKNTNQDHYCGKIETIDQYISEQAIEVQPILTQIREVIRATAPDATERISWHMPTFWQTENLIHFAAFKNHISIFPGGEASTAFAGRLTGYKTARGTIQFPLSEPVPYDLIEEITRWRVYMVEEKNKISEKTYEYDALIHPSENGGAYLIFPYDIRVEGSIVNMGVKNTDRTICYIIGIRKDIHTKIDKQPGDTVRVTIRERN